jgi:hypothetical protein
MTENKTEKHLGGFTNEKDYRYPDGMCLRIFDRSFRRSR